MLRYAARSDRGLIRATNQDSVFAGNRLLVIADGMGGHAAGDTASRLVVAAFAPLNARIPAPDLLSDLLTATRDGNDAIAETVVENPDLDGMGTTLTAMLFDGDRVGLAHVGDSRAYLYRSGVLHQLTHDDTFVQSLVDDGRITENEASHHPQRNLLLRALNGTDLDPSLALREVRAGDRYLLCSDGLHGVVGAEPIADTLADPDPERAADTLIQRALLRGGPDNVTVIVADVIDTGTAPMPGPVIVAGDTSDPDATGPLQQLTREMPRVPLPAIPEEPGAPADYLPADDEDQDFDDTDDDGDFDDTDDTDGEDFDDADDDGDGRRDENRARGDGDLEDTDGDGHGAFAGDGGGDAGTGDGHAGDGHAGDGHAGRSSAGRARARTGPPRPGPADERRAQRRRWHRRGALTLAIAVLVLVALGGSTLWVRSQYYVGANGDTVAVFRGVNGSLLGLSFASFQEDSCAGKAGCTPIRMTDLQPAARNQVLAGIPAASLSDARGVMARLSGQLLPPCPSPVASTQTGAAGNSSAPGSATQSPAGTTSGAAGTPGGAATARTAGTSAGGADGAPAAPSGVRTPAGTQRSPAPTTRTAGTAGTTTATTASAEPAGRTGRTTSVARQQRAGAASATTTSGTGMPAANAPVEAAAGRAVVTLEPQPITRTVLTTVTASPPGLLGDAVARALQGPAAPAPAAGTTRRTPTTHAPATGTATSGTAAGGAAGRSGEPTTTVTDTTPTVTITQTVTAPPTVTGTPLAPAPAVPGVTCRIVP